MSQMSLDNDGEPLPQGYGLSFDCMRMEGDEELVPWHFVHPERTWYPPFKRITRTLLSREINDWVTETREGFETFEPHVRRLTETEAGIGGTYFCTGNNRAHVAVFKPYDEEYGARYNRPSGSSTGLTQYNTSSNPQAGKGAAREIAAYLLDHPTKSDRRKGFDGPIEGFCRVPATVPVSCVHGVFNYGNTPREHGYVWYKFGSLQKFMENSGSCSDMEDDELLEDNDIQKLCLLDMRFANRDRHLGNLLKKVNDNDRYELIPIDHGCCFPDNFKGCRFEWLKWKKTRNNFSREIVEYIESLDSKADIELLIKEKFTVSYIFARNLAITTMLLKEAVKKELTPFEIAHFMHEDLPDESDEDYSKVKRAISLLVGEEQLEKISALQKIVSESIAELVVAKIGEEFRTNPVALELVEKHSKVQGMNMMTKQQVEDELLEIVSNKLSSNIEWYANDLRA